MIRSNLHLAWLGLIVGAIGLVSPCGWAQEPFEADPQQFQADLRALTRDDHRLIGTEPNRAAGQYIEQRLREIGLADSDILRLDFLAPTVQIERCELTVGQTTVRLRPMRPNTMVYPTTPAEGISGPLIYVGSGELSEYGSRSAEDAIVVMNYDCFDNWTDAFSMGAKAVIFIGDGSTPALPKHVSLPANLLRFYIDRDQLQTLDITEDQASATIHSRVKWQEGVGRNIIAYLPGTDPVFNLESRDREAVVISAHYDSYGQVPTLSPAARSAANVAGLLQAAEYFKANRPRRDIVLAFFDGYARKLQGAREFYAAIGMTDAQIKSLAEDHQQEAAFRRRAVELLNREADQFAEALHSGAEAAEGVLTSLKFEAEFIREDYAQNASFLRLQRQRMWAQLNQLIQRNRRIDRLVEVRADPVGPDDNQRQPQQSVAELRQEQQANMARIIEVARQIPPTERRIEQLDKYRLLWDEARRALTDNKPHEINQWVRQKIVEEQPPLDIDEARQQLQAMSDAQRAALADEITDGGNVLTTLEIVNRLADLPADQQWLRFTELSHRPDDQEEARQARLNESELQRRMIQRLRQRGLRSPEQAQALVEEVSIPRKLWEAALKRMDGRLQEINLALAIDQQREQLRLILGLDESKDRKISLHVSYNFADGGRTWAAVVGGDMRRLLWGPTNEHADSPGFYTGVFRALRQAAEPLEGLTLDMDRLDDPNASNWFAPGHFVNDGAIAGVYGIYNVALMTGYDARSRDGHPANTLDQLDWPVIADQAAQANRLVGAAADLQALSLRQQFHALPLNTYPHWNNVKYKGAGNFAGLQVTGGLKEDRPANGALVATWPGNRTAPFDRLLQTDVLLDVELFALDLARANGLYGLVSARSDLYENKDSMVLGVNFGPEGEIQAISNQETLITRNPTNTRVNLFPCHAHVLPAPLLSQPMDHPFLVLQAVSNSEFPEQRYMVGTSEQFDVFFVRRGGTTTSIKVYQNLGPVVLNVPERRGMTASERLGVGMPFEALSQPVPINRISATDLTALNGFRLATLQARNVTYVDLEVLHGRSQRSLESAEQARQVDEQMASFGRSLARARRVHEPVRTAMNDLVNAIVMLLLLAIPFAFALERLLIGATTIYMRIGGFVVLFLITFGLLYMMHPGFAIATTPIIIFLAFTILLLSTLVIYIVVRKFSTEMRALQGVGSRLHDAELSKMGTLLAAVNMGMSTMRRRPLRTTLTAVTVVMLTFTILCFASVGSKLGVRHIYEGPVDDDVATDIFIRQVDYSEMNGDVMAVIDGHQGPGGHIFDQWWLSRPDIHVDPFPAADPAQGKAGYLQAVLGLRGGEARAWPQLAQVLGGEDLAAKIEALDGRGVYLPAVIRDQLDLKVGQAITLDGVDAIFAGIIDANALQRLNQLDAKPLLPVDFQDASYQSSQDQSQQEQEQDEQLADVVQRDFVRLSPDQIAIASAQMLRRMGGTLHGVAVYAGPDRNIVEDARYIAELLPLPVWARTPNGVERLVFTRLTQLSGGLALVVPVILGGLIIFGTMLGSIADREKEIYTFSALGLAPAHVGFLFFAEAAVYAVVGGMVGQILALGVAKTAMAMAEAGWIAQPSINFSSTNALFAIAVVMATVLISAVYPAMRASKSANPGVQRSWKMPPPEGDDLKMTFPFTVSAYDITGVISFLAEHFRQHNDAGLGVFAARDVELGRDAQSGNLLLDAELALAPFDLGVTQHFTLKAVPSEIPGVDEVFIHAQRLTGATGDWVRSNRVFIQDLRKQFLLWRTLSAEMIEMYRAKTLQSLGEAEPEAPSEVADSSNTGDSTEATA
jgi:hypothetical protein